MGTVEWFHESEESRPTGKDRLTGTPVNIRVPERCGIRNLPCRFRKTFVD